MSLEREHRNQPNPLKSGALDVCVKGILSKSWLTRDCFLFPAWDGNPPVIQIYESNGSEGKRSSGRVTKMFSLKDLKKVVVKQKGKENHLVVTTKKDKIVFMNNDHLQIVEWQNYLLPLISNHDGDSVTEDGVSCDGSDDAQHSSDACHSLDSPYSPDILIDENIIYDSVDPKLQFEVTVERNPDAERLHLSGNYHLVLSDFTFALVEKQYNKSVCIWPYKYIRRYGRTPELFSFESGRKCSTGPGWFAFHTSYGNDIFQIAQEKLKKMQQDEMMIPRGIQHENGAGLVKGNSLERELKENSHVLNDSKQVPMQSKSSKNEKKLKDGKKEKEKKDKKEEKDKKDKKDKKEEKEGRKTKGRKNGKELTLNTNGSALGKELTGEMKLGKAVLPLIDPNKANLRHIDNPARAKTISAKTPPATAVKPHQRLSGQKSEPLKTPPPTSPKPEDLYALPQGKDVSHSAFPKKAAILPSPIDKKVKSLYEENAYDEIDPKGTADKLAESTSFAYSEIENPKKAWKTQGLESERHIEHYAGTPMPAPAEDTEYELTEVKPTVTGMHPGKPVMSTDSQQDFTYDDYDHLDIQSVKQQHVPHKASTSESDIYSHTNMPGPTTNIQESPMVTVKKNIGNEYEEAVVMPR